jgi:hypothetical protein
MTSIATHQLSSDVRRELMRQQQCRGLARHPNLPKTVLGTFHKSKAVEFNAIDDVLTVYAVRVCAYVRVLIIT